MRQPHSSVSPPFVLSLLFLSVCDGRDGEEGETETWGWPNLMVWPEPHTNTTCDSSCEDVRVSNEMD